MAIQKPEEQLLLEIINRARLDPNAEAARLGIALNEGLAPGTITATAKQPLAMNDDLVESARLHSANMNARDFFAHVDPLTGTDPGDRAVSKGYHSAYLNEDVGENIAFRGSSQPVSANAAMVNQLHADLFIDAGIDGRGHRKNILLDDYKEIGNGFNVGLFTQNGQTFNSVMLTEDLGKRNDNRILTGVAYNDTVVNNDFYDINEARAGVQVKVGAVLKATGGAAGGYSGDIGNAAMNLSFSGGGLVGTLTVAIGAGTTNVKLDVVDGNTIFSSTNITLISGVTKAMLLGIANLSLTGSAAVDTLTGNRGANVINGNGGNDTLNGGNGGNDTLNGGVGNDILNGGNGVDTMNGGAGNDTYTVGVATDKTIEAVNGGTDKVNSSVTLTLAANVENLTLTGAAAINGTGNALANTIIGNAAANVLNGSTGNDILNGGAGKDTIIGGAGNDIIIFNTALSAANLDTISAYVAANDTIRLENAIFTQIGQTSGTLLAARYHEGAAAHDADDRIIYNNANGALIYDSNGNVAGGAIQFAKLAAGLAASLTNADFVVI